MYKVPEKGQKYIPLFKEAGKRYDVPWQLLARLAQQESSFNPDAYNEKSKAQGLMQFVPATAKDEGVDVKSPRSSIFGSAKYLSKLKKALGTWEKTLAGYNWGIGNVKRKGMEEAPAETRNYVHDILKDVGLLEEKIKTPRVDKPIKISAPAVQASTGESSMQNLTPLSGLTPQQSQMQQTSNSAEQTPSSSPEQAEFWREVANLVFKNTGSNMETKDA